jgi:hypothetical protein
MKVFVSWSGEPSQTVAQALTQAIGSVFSNAETWLSSAEIQPGQQWFKELMDALDSTKFAIACLTTRTKAAPWIMFEAGAASGKFGAMKLVPLMLNGDLNDLSDPLRRFQGVVFGKQGVRSLFQSINESLGKPLTTIVLNAGFESIWPDLEKATLEAMRGDKPTYDVFLSAPMAAFNSDAGYKPFRAEVMKVVKALRDLNLKVFCALELIESLADFDTAGIGAREDVEKLGQSGNFILIYPQALVTSALFEAGYALARGIPSRFFVKEPEDLPYLMRSLAEVFSNVSIIHSNEWKSYEDICATLKRSATAWFGKPLRAQIVQ